MSTSIDQGIDQGIDQQTPGFDSISTTTEFADPGSSQDAVDNNDTLTDDDFPLVPTTVYIEIGNSRGVAFAQTGTIDPSILPNSASGGSTYWEVWRTDAPQMIDHSLVTGTIPNDHSSYGVGVNGLFSFSAYDNAHAPGGPADFKVSPLANSLLHVELELRATFQNASYSARFTPIVNYPVAALNGGTQGVFAWQVPGSIVGSSGPPDNTPYYSTDNGTNLVGHGLFVLAPDGTQLATTSTTSTVGLNGWSITGAGGDYTVTTPVSGSSSYSVLAGHNYSVVDTTAATHIFQGYFHVSADSGPDFVINPTSLSTALVAGGASVTINPDLTVTSDTNYLGALSLTITGLPTGVTATPSTITPSVGDSVSVTYAAGSGTTPGSYTALVTLASGSLSRSQTVNLTIQAPAANPAPDAPLAPQFSAYSSTYVNVISQSLTNHAVSETIQYSLDSSFATGVTTIQVSRAGDRVGIHIEDTSQHYYFRLQMVGPGGTTSGPYSVLGKYYDLVFQDFGVQGRTLNSGNPLRIDDSSLPVGISVEPFEISLATSNTTVKMIVTRYRFNEAVTNLDCDIDASQTFANVLLTSLSTIPPGDYAFHWEYRVSGALVAISSKIEVIVS